MRTREFKSLNVDVKDLNDKTGEVAFYFGAYTKDLEGDIIMRTAYTKTLKENASNIYHNRDHSEACGKPMRIETDDKGAFCVSQLAIKTIVGNDTYEQYKAGLIKGHSQEFETIKAVTDPAQNARVIKELRLWGVTSVTNIPANLDTPTISIKSLSDIAIQMKAINDFLHKGNASDELSQKFCDEYKRLRILLDTKSEALRDMGIVHCDKCKSIILDPEGNKCQNCGRFINGEAKSLISKKTLKEFKFFE